MNNRAKKHWRHWPVKRKEEGNYLKQKCSDLTEKETETEKLQFALCSSESRFSVNLLTKGKKRNPIRDIKIAPGSLHQSMGNWNVLLLLASFRSPWNTSFAPLTLMGLHVPLEKGITQLTAARPTPWIIMEACPGAGSMANSHANALWVNKSWLHRRLTIRKNEGSIKNALYGSGELPGNDRYIRGFIDAAVPDLNHWHTKRPQVVSFPALNLILNNVKEVFQIMERGHSLRSGNKGNFLKSLYLVIYQQNGQKWTILTINTLEPLQQRWTVYYFAEILTMAPYFPGGLNSI